MKKKSIVSAGLVSATLLCATNTVVVYAQEPVAEAAQQNEKRAGFTEAASSEQTTTTVKGTSNGLKTDGKTRTFNFQNTPIEADDPMRVHTLDTEAVVDIYGNVKFNLKTTSPERLPYHTVAQAKALDGLVYSSYASEGVFWEKVEHADGDESEEMRDTVDYDFSISSDDLKLKEPTAYDIYPHSTTPMPDWLKKGMLTRIRLIRSGALVGGSEIKRGNAGKTLPYVNKVQDIADPVKVDGEKKFTFKSSFMPDPRESSHNRETLSEYLTMNDSSITIKRSYTVSKPQVTEPGVWQVKVKNTGNVVLGGFRGTPGDGVTKPVPRKFTDGTDILQPGEEKTINMPFEPAAGGTPRVTVTGTNLPEKSFDLGSTLSWGNNLTLGGKALSADQATKVKPNSQLLFQLPVKNTGDGTVTSVKVKLPNGKETTVKETILPGKSATLKIPYTPAKDERKLTFTFSNLGQKDKAYTVLIEPETATSPKPSTSAKPKPSTTAKPKPSTSAKPKPSTTAKPKPSTTAKPKPAPADPTPEKEHTNLNLGTITINPAPKFGEPFKLPLNQIKNNTKDLWTEMVVVSEDGQFAEHLDDKDALAVVNPGHTIPVSSRTTYAPEDTDVYLGEKKPKFTLYTGVPQSRYTGADLARAAKEFGTKVGTFEVSAKSVTDFPNYYNKVNFTTEDGAQISTKAVNLYPGQDATPWIDLTPPKSPEKKIKDLSLTYSGKTNSLSTDKNRQALDNVTFSAPKEAKKSVAYTLQAKGADFEEPLTLNRGEIVTVNVLKDDSKVPTAGYTRTIKGLVPVKDNDPVKLSKDAFDTKTEVAKICDEEGKCLTPDSQGEFAYAPTKKDFSNPKKFYLLDKQNFVLGKAEIKFTHKYTSSMLELEGNTTHKGSAKDTFKQELAIHNHTFDPLKEVYVAQYESNKHGTRNFVKKIRVPLKTPLQPGDSTVSHVEFSPEFSNVAGEHWVEFAYSNTPGEEERNTTGRATLDLTEDHEAPTQSQEEQKIKVTAAFRGISTKDKGVVVSDVDPTRGITLEVTNTGSLRMENVQVASVLKEKESGKEIPLKVYPSQEFNGTLMPGERAIFNAETPQGLDLNKKYTVVTSAIGDAPEPPKHQKPSDAEPDYGEDVSGLLVITPKEDRGDKAHIVVEEGGALPLDDPNEYVSAPHPEKIELLREDPSTLSRTYKNPDGTFVTITPDETQIRFGNPDSETYYRHRNGDFHLEQVNSDGTYRLFENDEPDLDKIQGRVDGVVDLNNLIGVHTENTTGINGEFHGFAISGLDTLHNQIPYLRHNVRDYYRNVIGASDADANRAALTAYMRPLDTSHPGLTTDDKGGVRLTPASAKAKGPGTYTEEFEVFDRLTFTKQRVTVTYTIHEDGTASLVKLISDGDMEFDVSVYRKKDGSDVTINEKGEMRDSNGTRVDRQDGRTIDGKQPNTVETRTTHTEGEQGDETHKEEKHSSPGFLASTGLTSGTLGVTLLALLSLIAAAVILRRKTNSDE